MKAWLVGLGVVAAAGLSGCAVYPAPIDAGVTVGVGAPVYVAPPPVYVAPQPYYYGYPYRGYHRGYHGHGHRHGGHRHGGHRHWR